MKRYDCDVCVAACMQLTIETRLHTAARGRVNATGCREVVQGSRQRHAAPHLSQHVGICARARERRACRIAARIAAVAAAVAAVRGELLQQPLVALEGGEPGVARKEVVARSCGAKRGAARVPKGRHRARRREAGGRPRDQALSPRH